MQKRTYKVLGKETIGNQWDLYLDIKLKQSLGDPQRIYVVIASTGGKWFVPVPLDMWERVKETADKLIAKAGPLPPGPPTP